MDLKDRTNQALRPPIDPDDDLSGSDSETARVDVEEFEEEEEEEEEGSSGRVRRNNKSKPIDVNRLREIPYLRLTSKRTKRTLFFWHLLVMMMSISIISVAFYFDLTFSETIISAVQGYPYLGVLQMFVKVDARPPDLHFRIIEELTFGMHMYGWTFFISTILYTTFFCHRLTFTWPLLAMFTLVSMTLQTSNMLVRLSHKGELASKWGDQMIESLKGYQINSIQPLSLKFDYLSMWGQCCGINSRYDFQDSSLKYIFHLEGKKTKQLSLLIPPTCCNDAAFRSGYNGIFNCTTRIQNFKKPACLQVLFSLLDNYKLVYVAALAIMIIDVFVHTYVYSKMIKDQEAKFQYDKLEELEKRRRRDLARLRGDVDDYDYDYDWD